MCAILQLRTRAARTKKGQFLVEGPQAVREALKAHLKKPILDAVYVTEAALTVMRILLSCWSRCTAPPPRRRAAASLCVW